MYDDTVIVIRRYRYEATVECGYRDVSYRCMSLKQVRDPAPAPKSFSTFAERTLRNYRRDTLIIRCGRPFDALFLQQSLFKTCALLMMIEDGSGERANGWDESPRT